MTGMVNPMQSDDNEKENHVRIFDLIPLEDWKSSNSYRTQTPGLEGW